MASRKLGPKKAKKRKSARGKLMADIRRCAATATKLRLDGKIPGAQKFEREVDRLTGRAQLKGWSDSAFTAETAGQQQGHEAHFRSKQ
jgi:hypothetical protein